MNATTNCTAAVEELTEGWYAMYSYREISTKFYLGYFSTEDEAYEMAEGAAADDRENILGDLAEDTAIQPIIFVAAPNASLPGIGVFA